MKSNLSANLLKQRIQAKINQIARSSICVSGSLVKINRKCGRPSCRCAQGGEKHPAFLLTSKVKGKTKSIYVPVELVEDVKMWTQEYRRIQKLLKEINSMSEQIIRQHIQVSRAVAKNKERLNR